MTHDYDFGGAAPGVWGFCASFPHVRKVAPGEWPSQLDLVAFVPGVDGFVSLQAQQPP